MTNKRTGRDNVTSFMFATVSWLAMTYAILVPFHQTGRRAFFMILMVSVIHIPFATGLLFRCSSKENLKESAKKPSTCGLLILSNYTKQGISLSFFLSLALVSSYVCAIIFAGYALRALQKPTVKWILVAIVAMVFL